MEGEVQIDEKKAKRQAQMAKAREARRKNIEERKSAADAPKAVVSDDTERITFFTEMDIDRKGRLRASYPFYMDRKRMDRNKEELRRYRGMVERGEVPAEYTGEVMERIRAYETEIHYMEEHMPKITKNLKKIRKYRDDLQDIIAPSMFEKKEMIDGIVDPNEEARRMSEPVIAVPDHLRQFISDNGGRISKQGKACRDDLVRVWQMCQDSFIQAGEFVHTDAEVLRKR
jgi:hypothetical protein